MQKEDIKKDKIGVDDTESCSFGVMGEILRTLQNEEDLAKSCEIQTPESEISHRTLDLISEINKTLQDIAETQKRILEELKKKNLG